jgi:hypothetical protein
VVENSHVEEHLTLGNEILSEHAVMSHFVAFQSGRVFSWTLHLDGLSLGEPQVCFECKARGYLSQFIKRGTLFFVK